MATALGTMATLFVLFFNSFHEWKTVEAYSQIAYGYNGESDSGELVKVTDIHPDKRKGNTKVFPENKELLGDTLAGVASSESSVHEMLAEGQIVPEKKVAEMMKWDKETETDTKNRLSVLENSIKQKYPFYVLNNGLSATEEKQSGTEEIEQQNKEILEEKQTEEKIKKAKQVKKTAVEPQIKLSKKDKSVLLRIVEAEATGEDIKGRMLVANVVLNRVNCKTEFGNNVTDVVFERTNGVYQFSPIEDGRYWSVTISDKTREAVNRVLNGEDYSKGALYFMARKYADSDNVVWFDDSLTWLFRHGTHEFFK